MFIKQNKYSCIVNNNWK